MRRALVVLLTLGLGSGAFAQVVPEREVEAAQGLFDAGNYAEALKRARDAMAAANFTDKQRIELHLIAALSAFNLADTPGAKRHFLQLLQLNPDEALDPFAVPPAAIRLFYVVKNENVDQLNLVRQQLAIRAEQEQRALAERERMRLLEEERRRRVEDLARDLRVRTVQRTPLWVNFVPFGAGQFQQGRTSWGVAFATVEAALGLTSIISYLAIEALFENVTYTWSDRKTDDGSFSLTLRQIPTARRGEANVWGAVKLSTGIAFYAAWALGVADALVHHQGEIVTETREPQPAVPAMPTPKLSVFLAPGGAGVGLSLSF